MKIYNLRDLSNQELEKLLSRAASDDSEVVQTVVSMLEQLRREGDAFLKSCNKRFESYAGERLFLDKEALAEIAASASPTLRKAIDQAAANIRKFHASQLEPEARIETMPGVLCWRERRAIERVGLYIPGGTAVLPSTFLMLAIPALLAGCQQIVVCTPPAVEGTVSAALAYCAVSLGIEKIFLSGGAQAIGAMAYGTESIPKVDKIFGPGNRYVMQAKLQVQSAVAIDMPAGPSEVLVLADACSKPDFIAADLLAQAEHGTDSQVVLVSTSTEILDQTKAALEQQLELLPRAEIAAAALNNSFFLKADGLEEAVNFSNLYAPEHLIISTEDPQKLLPMVSSAGSVFLGNFTPESAGDYASGTNHTLPTSGFARAYSGVSVDSFVKKISIQEISKEGLQLLGPTIEVLAEAEGLEAHKRAVSIRLQNLNLD